MRIFILFFVVLFPGGLAVGQDGEDKPTREELIRKSLLQEAVSLDSGEVTAMEPLPDDSQGVIIGYSSGKVLHCYGEKSCAVFQNTPGSAVRTIAISTRKNKPIIWVAYGQGAIYQCIESACERFIWDEVRQP